MKPKQPPRTALGQVQKLIRKLPTEERNALIPFLATFPDSGIQSFDLKKEFETLKKFGKSSIGPTDDPADFLFELVFVRNLVSVRMSGMEVLRTTFFPENFREGFLKSPLTVKKFTDLFLEQISGSEEKAKLRDLRKQEGIEETDEQFEQVLRVFAETVGNNRMTSKVERVTELMTAHLPAIVADIFGDAYKAQIWVDTQNYAKVHGDKDQQLSNEQFKKLFLGNQWQRIKPYLSLDRNTRTKPEWRNDETLKQYAQLVNDRRSLTARIKDVYEDCDFDAGWMNELQEDATFQRLSVGISSENLKFAMKRAADDGVDQREREPLSIACEMARRELGLPEQGIDTLRNYYFDGNKLLKKDRADRGK